MEDTFERVCFVISDHFNLPDKPLTANTSIKDLTGDNIDALELSLKIGAEFNIKVTAEDCEKEFHEDATISSITAYILRKIGDVKQ